jgi:hypothetical protein
MLINRLSGSEEQEELTNIDEKSSHKYYSQNNFSDSYILVGSDFAFGLE